MRRGYFKVSGTLLRNDPDLRTLKVIMEDVVVFHVESRVDLDELTYFAYHPDFEDIPNAQLPTEYEAVISCWADGTLTNKWRPL